MSEQLDTFMESQKERQRRWLQSVSHSPARRIEEPPDPPPPQPPTADAPAREWLDWWRMKASGDFFGGYLFAAIVKIIDENEALTRRIERLEEDVDK